MAELIDLFIMIVALGIIFRGIFAPPTQTRPAKKEGPGTLLTSLAPVTRSSFFWREFFFAVMIAAPAVVFHEAAHKVVGILFGQDATFHAHLPFLAFGILLRLFNAGFIFFVPGYVSVDATVADFDHFFIALAGPLANLFLFALAMLLLRFAWTKRYHYHLRLVRRINLFLFFFNIIPIPPFDGFHIVTNAWALLF